MWMRYFIVNKLLGLNALGVTCAKPKVTLAMNFGFQQSISWPEQPPSSDIIQYREQLTLRSRILSRGNGNCIQEVVKSSPVWSLLFLHGQIKKLCSPWHVDEVSIRIFPGTTHVEFFLQTNLTLIQARLAPAEIQAMIDDHETVRRRHKECLITTGATAPFTELVQFALSKDCIATFKRCGFTHITMQIGESLEYVTDEIKNASHWGVEVNAFAFNPKGLSKEMKALKGKAPTEEEEYEEGLLICHAGKLYRIFKYPQYSCNT